ncbi:MULTISPECIES: hypothetical protein [Vibrio]|uniref:hypothetical protein n=1 Tax=Vibrio TaxID=662 RepID=UPI000C162E3D|nr:MULTISPECIES: hypothetical protein [Vibrio]NNN44541.1 hypothetical protein [Vibrio sp. 1-1(7)]NNN73057.1 hypothetical protein [Vibrio sp. 12-2(3-a)]
MNKTIFERAVLDRLLVEKNFSLLIDADQHDLDLPNEEDWQRRLEQSEPDSWEANFLAYLHERDQHLESLPIVGGELTQSVIQRGEAIIWSPDKIAIPALRELQQYAKRILVKIDGLNTQIILITDANYPRPNKALLIQYANAVRQKVVASFELGKNNLHSVSITVLMLGEIDNDVRHFAKQNTKRMGMDRNFIHYVCVDALHEHIWTPTPIRSGSIKQVIKATFSSLDHRLETLFNHYNAVTVSWPRIVLSGLGAFIITTAMNVMVASFDIGFLSMLSRILVPTLVFVIAFATMKNRTQAYKQIMFSLLIYLTLLLAMLFYFSPPGNFGEWLNLAQLLFLTSMPALIIGRVLEITR